MKQNSFPQMSRSRRVRTWLILILLLVCMTGSRTVHLTASAAKESSSKATAKTLTVMFRDNSGKYLKKRGKNWYLYNKDRQPLKGLRYLNIAKTENLLSGFYMFDQKGCLIQEKTVYQFKDKTVKGVTFNGLYCTTDTGRFPVKEGLRIIPITRKYGKIFGGYYYTRMYGKISGKAQMRRLKNIQIGKRLFDGYYYFDQDGRLCTRAGFYTVNQKIGSKSFKGKYYFGGDAGKLVQKSGWVVYNQQLYCINASGKMLTSCWLGPYYLQADGTIAYSKRVPDGGYVGYDGRKCSGPDAALSTLSSQLRSMVYSYSGTWSVYVKDLKTGGVINISDRSMYPASTIKAFVMASTYDRIYRGKLAYSSTIRSLLNNMITISDNESYNALVRYNSSSGSFLAGAAEVNNYLSRNGYSYTRCRHTLHPSSSAHIGSGSNTTSAKECGILLERIYRGQCVSAAYSREMLNLLLAQTRRWKIPSGVPSGVKVANKTGETSNVQNDIAIVFGPKTDYVLCIFSETGNEYYSNTRIRSISQKVYNFLN